MQCVHFLSISPNFWGNGSVESLVLLMFLTERFKNYKFKFFNKYKLLMFSVSPNVSFLRCFLKWKLTPICLIVEFIGSQCPFILSVMGVSLMVILFEFRILFFSVFCLIRVTRGLSMFIASAFDEKFITFKIALSTCSDQWFWMQQLLQPNSRLFYDPLQFSHASLQSLPGPDPINQYASFGSIWFDFSESYAIYGLFFHGILFLEFICTFPLFISQSFSHAEYGTFSLAIYPQLASWLFLL